MERIKENLDVFIDKVADGKPLETRELVFILSDLSWCVGQIEGLQEGVEWLKETIKRLEK